MLGLSVFDTVFGGELLDSLELLGLCHVDDLIFLVSVQHVVRVVHLGKGHTKVRMLEVLFEKVLSLAGSEELLVVVPHELCIIIRLLKFRFVFGRHRNHESIIVLCHSSRSSGHGDKPSLSNKCLGHGSVWIDDSRFELLRNGLSRVGTHDLKLSSYLFYLVYIFKGEINIHKFEILILFLKIEFSC